MLFNSLSFLLFFVVTLALYQCLPSWNARKLLLLIASYVFYAAWNPIYVLVLMASTLADWWLAQQISQSKSESSRRALLATSIVANLALLAFFKYGNFAVENVNSLAKLLGLPVEFAAPGILLPIAISFYTFASLSYTIDVYRRQIPADASLTDYALFVAFFPHLVAGPILRASYLLPQFATPRTVSRDDLGWGLTLMILGLFAKVVLADALLAPVVNDAYAAPANIYGPDVLAALFAFSGQIYYDFCGYSLCAIGIARCFGFVFPDNFRYPYAAHGFSDFWRRWHISLSTWLRDYLYISLGGNRGSWRVYRNLLLTMLVAGLWHGASWMFVLWGGLHGLMLVLERMFRNGHEAADPADEKPQITATVITFLIVTALWIPFRASTPADALAMIAGLLRWHDAPALEPAGLAAAVVVAATVMGNMALRNTPLRAAFERMPQALQIGILSACLVALYLYSGSVQQSFIYFQF